MQIPADQCTQHIETSSAIAWATVHINGTLCARCSVGWSIDMGTVEGWTVVPSLDALFLYRNDMSQTPTTGVITITADVTCNDTLVGQYTATLTLIE